MALILKDRVLESSTTTGTGSFTLTGAQTGYQSFSAIGNGNTTYYTIQGKNADGTLTGEWEVGVGTWSTGNTLSRDTVLSNSLGTTAKIVFSAGAKDVFCDYPASKSVNQNADGTVNISSLTASQAVFTDASKNLISKSVTGTGNVVLDTSPRFGFNTGFGVAPITWFGNYNSLQVGYGGAISNITSAASLPSEMSISSNLKNTTSYYAFVNNGYATRYYQVDGVHRWAADTLNGSGIANDPANMQDVMTLDNFGNLTAIGGFAAQTGGFLGLYSTTLDSASGTLSINTGGLGNTDIGSVGTGFTTTLNDDTVRINGTLLLVGSATTNQNIATTQTTGTLTIGGTSGTGAITLGRSTGAQTINIATGINSSATKAVNIGTGSSGGATNIAIGATSGTSTTTVNGYFKPPALASAPTYVKGAVYFDTTLNKLRVGGATTWETITSI